MSHATTFIPTLRRHAPVIVWIIALATLWSASPVQAQQELPLEILVIETLAGKHLFQVEVARTDTQRAVGLMWRERMDPNKGMLFDFKNERFVTMWMKNTPLSLDMLFISIDGRIATIATHTRPYSTERIQTAEGLSRLPTDYTNIPQLGPPLPGELGRPILSAQQRGQPVPAIVTAPAVDPDEQRRLQELEAARSRGGGADGGCGLRRAAGRAAIGCDCHGCGALWRTLLALTPSMAPLTTALRLR